MRSSSTKRKKPPSRGFIRNLLTFERLVTGPLAVLIYWAGLAVIALIGFFAVGAAVGLALHNDGSAGLLLAVPVVVGGVLVVSALVLIWRALCEFYVAIFRISDDLRALRLEAEAQAEAEAEARTRRLAAAPTPAPQDAKPTPPVETPLDVKPEAKIDIPAPRATPLSF